MLKVSVVCVAELRFVLLVADKATVMVLDAPGNGLLCPISSTPNPGCGCPAMAETLCAINRRNRRCAVITLLDRATDSVVASAARTADDAQLIIAPHARDSSLQNPSAGPSPDCWSAPPLRPLRLRASGRLTTLASSPSKPRFSASPRVRNRMHAAPSASASAGCELLPRPPVPHPRATAASLCFLMRVFAAQGRRSTTIQSTRWRSTPGGSTDIRRASCDGTSPCRVAAACHSDSSTSGLWQCVSMDTNIDDLPPRAAAGGKTKTDNGLGDRG